MFKSLEKYFSQPKQLILGFFIVFLFHLVFKSLFLDYSGFWYDETFGLWYSQQDWGLIKHTSEWDLNPPFYYYFLWIWRNLFGISEFSIRFSSVLFSALSAGMIYIFSTKFFNRITGIIAVLIYTSSSTFLFFAHEARCYSMVSFFTLASSWFFLKLLEEKKISSTIFLGIFNFLLIYTHYLTGFLLLSQGLITILFFEKKFFKQFCIAAGITALLAFWRFTAKTIALIFHHEKSFWLTTASFYDLKMAFFDFFNDPATLLFYVVLLAIIIGYLLLKKQIGPFLKENRIKLLYLSMCGVFTVLLCFLISLKTPLFLMRYLLYTAPFMYILVGFLISKLERIPKLAMTGLVALVSIYSFSNLDLRTEKSMNFRGAMPVIKKLKSPTTAILVETRDVGPLFAYYYDKDIFADYYNMQKLMNQENVYFVSTPEDVKAIDLNKFDKIILTQTFEILNPANDSLLEYIKTRYQQRTSVKYYNEVNILAFSR